jgi:hypothetical protein
MRSFFALSTAITITSETVVSGIIEGTAMVMAAPGLALIRRALALTESSPPEPLTGCKCMVAHFRQITPDAG